MIIIALIYLTVLGIKDYVNRQIPILWLAVGAIILPGMGVYRLLQGELNGWEIFVGILPGVFFLLLARLSGKAGYADGIVMTEMGLFLGYREMILLICFSLLLISVTSMVLLSLGKVHKDTQMPYLTFLAIVFLVRQIC